MKTEDFEKPIVAIANSFTQFVPGHVHLHEIGQRVKEVVDGFGGTGWSSIRLRWTMGLRWGTMGCCTRCRVGS